jgi:hypothetical protein
MRHVGLAHQGLSLAAEAIANRYKEEEGVRESTDGDQ